MEDLDRCWVVVKGCDGRGSCSLKNDLDGGLVNGYWSLGTESATSSIAVTLEFWNCESRAFWDSSV